MLEIDRTEDPVVIVGAGMAGLSCAVHLHRAGLAVRIFESSDGVGGRVRTDIVKGFRLDRGFQVYLDAYEETGKLLDLDALELQPFEPGALIYKNNALHCLMDVFRRPSAALASVRAPVGSFGDKLRVGWMRNKLLRRTLESIANQPNLSTEAYLREAGFSEDMIDSFFRSFYGGIFLERELRTSSRMFEFTFKMFGKGSATLPSKGMGEIPTQLAAGLPEGTLSLETSVAKVGADHVMLDTGERISASHVVIATNGSCAKRLLPAINVLEPKWRSVTNVYFAANQSPVRKPIICLNGTSEGLVNNVCVLTDAAPEYSEDGRALVSVSLLGLPNDENLETKVASELAGWFGKEVENWEHLRTDRIEKALPEQLPATDTSSTSNDFLEAAGVYICGDHCASASIEGAVISGKRVAESILRAGVRNA